VAVRGDGNSPQVLIEEARMLYPNTIALLGVLLATAASGGLVINDVGRAPIDAGGTGASELSGLTWAGGDRWYAVSDSGARLFPMTVTIDSTTGAVTSAVLDPAISLAAGTDLEGVAFAGATVVASDETGPALREYSLGDGSVVAAVPVPAVYSTARANYSLESLARQPGGTSLWTANEEALSVDGPISTSSAGTVVRLQKFDAALAPAGQWAYVADPHRGAIPIFNTQRSGVSDLVVLPDGQILVLERENGFSLTGPFRNRIYGVEFAGATDTSALAGLDGASYTPVTKELLWEGIFLASNFEGLALGPQLGDGSYALLMVSDDGGPAPLTQELYALRLTTDNRTAIPEPGVVGPWLPAVALALRRRRRA
jgi:hypothetical protein